MDPKEARPTAERGAQTSAPERSGAPLLAIVAIVLSLAALGVSVFEVSTIRDEQRIQAWPYVSLTEHYGPEGFRIDVTNKGIGPARVRDVIVRFDGEVYDNLDELILNAVGEENAFSYDLYSVTNPAFSVMSPEERIRLFAVPWEPRTRLLVEQWEGRVEVNLCYCSVYDECWVSRLTTREPEPVGTCPAS